VIAAVISAIAGADTSGTSRALTIVATYMFLAMLGFEAAALDLFGVATWASSNIAIFHGNTLRAIETIVVKTDILNLTTFVVGIESVVVAINYKVDNSGLATSATCDDFALCAGIEDCFIVDLDCYHCCISS